MHSIAILVWSYGLVVLAGGIVGWAKARSLPSLIAGGVFGLALLASGVGIWLGMAAAIIAAFALAISLLITMAIRLVKTKKFMPAGLIVLLSAFMVAALGLVLFG